MFFLCINRAIESKPLQVKLLTSVFFCLSKHLILLACRHFYFPLTQFLLSFSLTFFFYVLCKWKAAWSPIFRASQKAPPAECALVSLNNYNKNHIFRPILNSLRFVFSNATLSCLSSLFVCCRYDLKNLNLQDDSNLMRLKSGLFLNAGVLHRLCVSRHICLWICSFCASTVMH